MRLLHLNGAGNLSLVECLGNEVPSYAILSHTWGPENDEVSFKDLMGDGGKSKAGYRKIRFCAEQAARDNIRYFWIDTCCIDKSSSAELSEAINSMFRWYQNAERCYVYLSDVSRGPSDGDESGLQRWKLEFMGSRWFTRGWTLQELIAPASVEFFSHDWIHLGSKGSMEQTIHERTGVAIGALRGERLSHFTMDERFMWAEKRTTTREEDAAYCLLGIFDIQMPLLYGEGRKKAQNRLEKEIKESLGNRIQSLSDEQKQTLLDSLRFDQIDARQMTIKTAHAKTCKWMLRKSEYLDWLNATKLREHHGFLWIKGKPGTGKSTLMKFALANARKTMKDRIAISFFFNARGEEIEKSTIGTYRSLLLQLLERLPALRSVFDSLGLSMSSTITDNFWTIESLKMLLEDAIQSLGESPVVCFIDALDECEEAQIRDMISFFERVGELTASSGVQFQVCFSSRHYPHITIRKGLDLVLEGQEGHTQDIANYLETDLKIGKGKVAQQVRSEIQEKASGVFMWVVLVVEILNKEHDKGRMDRLLKRLEEIPSELHELFRNILTRDSDNRDGLILCIQWVLFAKQPLSPEQLYFAILSGVEMDAVSKWDPKQITRDAMMRFILDSSKGLTEITKSKLQKVQFIHESVRDFLLKEDGLSNIWPDLGGNFQGQSHQRLKQCCLNYMSVDVFAPLNIPDILPKASSPQAADFRKSASHAFPFLEYAVQNVLYHANAAEGSGITQLHFLKNFQLPRWIRVVNLFQQHEVRRYSADVSLLYLLGEHNTPHLIGIHPSAASSLEVENERYGCPLFAAMATRSKEAIKMFLKCLVMDQSPTMESDKADTNNFDEAWGPGRDFRFSRNRSLFSYSVEFGCERAVSFLLKTGKFDAQSMEKDGGKALLWAAKKGHEAVINMLLKIDKVQVNSKDRRGRTALSWGVENGHEAVVRLLLETGKVDIDSKDNSGRTALSWGVEKGHEAVVRLLLETGEVDVNAKDVSGRATLFWATEKRCEAAVRLLLETGKVETDLETLLWAAENGHEAAVELLLDMDKGIDINAQSAYFGNALYVASSSGNERMVRILLDKGANVNAQSDHYDNALYIASANNHEKVVQMLLDKGADVNAQRYYYGDALQVASSSGHEGVVRILLDKGANVNAQSDHYGNALYIASVNNHEKVVQLLLENGADVNAQGGYCGNALQAASCWGHENIVQVLLDEGADVNAQGGKYGNALEAVKSSWKPNEKVVQIILQHMTDSSAEKAAKRSASQAGIGSDDEDVVAKKPKAADTGSPSTHAGAEGESANVGRGDENKDKTWASVVLCQD